MHALNFETEMVESGEAACSILSTRSLEFAGVLMDLRMTGITGFEATQKLRDMGYSRPIVILSAESRELVEEAYAAGANFMLEKPAGKDDLVHCFHSIGLVST